MKGDEFFCQIETKAPLVDLSAEAKEILRRYLSAQKVIGFGDHLVAGTLLPPYPGPAFDNLFRAPPRGGPGGVIRVATISVTNQCPFRCWHCYNANRRVDDLPMEFFRRIGRQLQDRGACRIILSGGEPLLRDDLADICRCFDDRSFLILSTTGWQLSLDRARQLKDAGLFAVAVSLDSQCEQEHNSLRGRDGAFQAAIRAVGFARDAGLFPVVVTVARRELLERQRLFSFLEFARDVGALQVSLGEPMPVGRLAGRSDVMLRGPDRKRMLEYQQEVADRADLPILETDTHIGGRESFGCNAGGTYIHIDGTGNLCPCNFIPLSFGNLARESLSVALARMRRYFCRPRSLCAARRLARRVPPGLLPTIPEVSDCICDACLPDEHPVPGFFVAVAEPRREGASEPWSADAPATARAESIGKYVSDSEGTPRHAAGKNADRKA